VRNGNAHVPCAQPQIRDRVAREAYGDAFMDELGREYAALHKQESGGGDMSLGCIE